MKAAVFYQATDLRILDIPKPTPKAGEVLLKVKACGICGTDVHIFHGGVFLFPSLDNPARVCYTEAIAICNRLLSKLQFIGELPRPPVTKWVKGEALH